MNDTTANTNNIDENAYDVQNNEAGKEPQLSTEISFEEPQFRTVFQNGHKLKFLEI